MKDFAESKEHLTVFFNAKAAQQLVAHADDFTYSGTKKELEEIEGKREWYDITKIKEVTILVRTVRWTAEELECDVDATDRRRIVEAEGLEEDSKVTRSPAVKEDNGKAELDEMDCVADEHRGFEARERRLITWARTGANHYAVKEIGTSSQRGEAKRGSRRLPGT